MLPRSMGVALAVVATLACGATQEEDAQRRSVCDGSRIIESDEQFDALALENCAEIRGSLSVRGITRESLDGLQGLEKIGSQGNAGSLTIEGNDQLTTLRGLNTLKEVFGAVHIESNPALETLEGLEGLRYVQGWLMIEGNATLSSLDALQDLWEIGAKIEIEDNPQLPQCEVDAFLVDRPHAVSTRNGQDECSTDEPPECLGWEPPVSSAVDAVAPGGSCGFGICLGSGLCYESGGAAESECGSTLKAPCVGTALDSEGSDGRAMYCTTCCQTDSHCMSPYRDMFCLQTCNADPDAAGRCWSTKSRDFILERCAGDD
jgi:hypothetical protein